MGKAFSSYQSVIHVPSAWIEWFPTSSLGQSLLPLWIISWPPSLPPRHSPVINSLPSLPQDFSGMFMLLLITAVLFNFTLLRVGVPSYLYFQELELDKEMETHTHTHTHTQPCRMITALQNFAVFCQTSTRISHRYTYVPSLSKLPPTSLSILPF